MRLDETMKTKTTTKTKTINQVRAIWNGIEVRRHNGRCSYGGWLIAADEIVPNWVWEYAETSMVEDRVDSGLVEKGGSKWQWRQGSDGWYVVEDLGWWSLCGNLWHGFESDEASFDGCAILLVGGPRDGEVVA